MWLYHPWRHLNLAFPHVTVTLVPELPIGVMGRWTGRGIELHRTLTQAERRSTLAHEIVHLERGPVPDDPRLEAREERIVDEIAARRLIDLAVLADALAWCQGVAGVECADEVWTDLDTLSARIASLSDTEWQQLDDELRRRN